MTGPTYEELPHTPITTVPSTNNKTGGWRTFRPVFDLSKCTKCYLCWKFCPDVAIKIKDELPEVDYDYCKGCGICKNVCKFDVVEMVIEE